MIVKWIHLGLNPRPFCHEAWHLGHSATIAVERQLERQLHHRYVVGKLLAPNGINIGLTVLVLWPAQNVGAVFHDC